MEQVLGWGGDFEKWWVSRRVSKGVSTTPVQSLFWYCRMLNFVKALSRYALLKARYSVEDPFFQNPILDQIWFWSGTKSDLGLGPNPIWVSDPADLISDPTRIWSWTQLGFGLGPTQLGFGLGPNSDLVSDPNQIWSRIQIRFGLGSKSDLGLGSKSDLVSDPNPIWSWSQVGFGLGANSDLVSDPTRIWSRTQIPIWSWTQIPIWSRTLVCRNLVTLKMVTPKLLGTQLHRTGVQHWW